MKKILFILAHPHLHRSRANRSVLDVVHQIPGVTVRELYELYPYFHIDVATEQKLLLEHDLVVVQHPFYWYSMPPLMKQWLDDVLESGWAYGPGGDKLKGKDFLLSITTGGPEESYAEDGYNKFGIEQFLPPWKQTVGLCQMNWLEPRIFHGAIRAPKEALGSHALNIKNSLEHYLADGRLT